MAKKSIGTYHATIAATAQPFINELKRADNESRRATASIRSSISKTMRDVQREFSLPKLAKGVFAGFGIGGGMQLVDLGITKLVEAFQAGAKHAEEMSEAIDKMRSSLRDMRQDKFQNVMEGSDLMDRPAVASRELSYTADLLAQAERRKEQSEKDLVLARSGGLLFSGPTFDPETGPVADPFGGRYGNGKTMAGVGEAAVAAQTKALEEIEALRKRIGDLTKTYSKAVDDAAKPILEADQKAKELFDKERADAMRELAVGRKEEDRNLESYILDREKEGQDYFGRAASAGRVQVDDMTRRGLGTGADYKSVQEQTNTILSQILEVIRAAKANATSGMVPRYGD